MKSNNGKKWSRAAVFMLVTIAGLAVLASSCEDPVLQSSTTTTTTTIPAITLLAISPVAVPVRGQQYVPQTIDTSQFTGTTSWNPAVNGPFAAGIVYTATITLTAKPGWTLNGVAANSFAVAGAISTNAANSGTITAVFPITQLLDLVQVPGGTFQRDADPLNKTTVGSFSIGKYEITRAQYLAILGTDPSNTTRSSGTNDPVQKVNWYQAIAFCNKLSIQEGLTEAYSVSGVNFATLAFSAIPTDENSTWDAAALNTSATGYRLPTEAEWEWAAMGAPVDGQGTGTNTTGWQKAFAGSTGINDIGAYAVFGLDEDDPGATTSPVGSKLPNELGLYDMSGNVFEWVYDRSSAADYDSGQLTNPQGAASASVTDRGVRGGGWLGDASWCTVAKRGYSYPESQNNFGFRVVRP